MPVDRAKKNGPTRQGGAVSISGGADGIDSSLRSSPFGRTACVQTGLRRNLSNPLRGYSPLPAPKKTAPPVRVEPFLSVAERTGLEPATPGVTGRYSNQLNYRSESGGC